MKVFLPIIYCRNCWANYGAKIKGKIIDHDCRFSGKYLHIKWKCPRCGCEWPENRRYSKVGLKLKCDNCGREGKIIKIDKRIKWRAEGYVRITMMCGECGKEWRLKVWTRYY